MNKIANVVFAYSPKNDDELELTVGDKIEILGFEEEGWWKGKLKGRIGVFPSNFVHVETTTASTTTSEASSPLQQHHSTTSTKLNSIFGSKLSSKSSLSSNSLNTINSTSNNSLNNNISQNNNNNNNNLNMNCGSNNTHQLPPSSQHNPVADSISDSTHHHNNIESNNNSFNELRPKPIRGVGYGDIFAAGAKAKPSESAKATCSLGGGGAGFVASERLNNSLIGSTLQKPIPKKPPPPTPGASSGNTINNSNNHDATSNSQNGSIINSSTAAATSDQAPALPPKPSPFMQQQARMHLPVRPQARVIHDYEPKNSDELDIRVNDIINIIDKKSEDKGWWRGELNGKIGVFPDNFVLEINVHDQQVSSQVSTSNQSDWSTNRVTTGGTTTSSVFSPPQQQQISGTESRVKSVFSSTPKGFSKELESNLEKHNSNPASFLSLKRNKLSSQTSVANDPKSITANASNKLQMNMGFVSSGKNSDMVTSANSSATNGHPTSLLENSSPTKLNHITANRAKGPSRRPPSNILKRNNQTFVDPYVSIKKESSSSNDSSREEQPSMIGLLNNAAGTTYTVTNSINYHDVLPALPPADTTSPQQHKQSPVANAAAATTNSTTAGPVSINAFTTSTTTSNSSSAPSMRSSSINNTVDNNQVGPNPMGIMTPKTSQRTSQQQVSVPDNNVVRSGQKTPTSATGSPPTSTPPWMVNLRKTNAEKKRDPITTTTATTPTPTTPTIQATAITTVPPTVIASSVFAVSEGSSTPMYPVANYLNNGENGKIDDATIQQAQSKQEKTHSSAPPLPSLKGPPSQNFVSITQLNESLTKYDDLYKKISNDVTNELSELKRDVRQLQQDLCGINEIKSAIETIKIELKTCQSATENQRKYIKELVNNLADERKKIAAMQEELDKNLK